MRRLVWIGLLIGVWSLIASTSFATEKMKPGLWEITTSMDMTGMPMKIPPQTIRHCYTAQDVEKGLVPESEGCSITELKTSGNKTSWKTECKGEMAGTGEGQMILLGDSAYEGSSSIKTQGMTMNMKYAGKRIGDCK